MLRQLYRFVHPRFQKLFLEYKVNFQPRYGHGKPPHPQLYEIIDSHRGGYMQLLKQFHSFIPYIHEIKKSEEESDSSKPAWNNGFLPGFDMIAIYAMLSLFKPKNYIEVGSGNSTKTAYKAKQDQSLDMKIISIDPMPRTEIDSLTDEVIRKPVEETGFDFISRLRENDVLFIDNSHRILPNSDSMVFFMEVLPKLNTGVIVHLHDIYLPYDYPPFMCERFYSEQYGLAFYLMANPEKYKPILPNYFISEDNELSSLLMPFWNHKNLDGVERHGGSFWLQIG